MQPTKNYCNGKQARRCQATKGNGHQCENRAALGNCYCRNHRDGPPARHSVRSVSFSVTWEVRARIQKEAADQGISVAEWIRWHLPTWAR